MWKSIAIKKHKFLDHRLVIDFDINQLAVIDCHRLIKPGNTVRERNKTSFYKRYVDETPIMHDTTSAATFLMDIRNVHKEK